MTDVTSAAVGPMQHESQIRVALMGNLADEMRGDEGSRKEVDFCPLPLELERGSDRHTPGLSVSFLLLSPPSC